LAVSAEADLVAAGVLRQPEAVKLMRATTPAALTRVLLRMILLWISAGSTPGPNAEHQVTRFT